MNENPYSSPLTATETRRANEGVPLSRIASWQWLVVVGGWCTTLLAMLFTAMLVDRLASSVVSQAEGVGAMLVFAAVIIVSVLVGGRVGAIAYKWLYLRFATAIIERRSESK